MRNAGKNKQAESYRGRDHKNEIAQKTEKNKEKKRTIEK
jgi:hypothetical protein